MGSANKSTTREKERSGTLGIWTPQEGPQVDAITADWCPIVLYGGAKFGGKTDFILGDYLQDVIKYGQHWQGILFRRALTEFTEIKLRSKELYPKAGATWHEQAHEWRFPNGAILRFKYLEKFEDISLYEGHCVAEGTPIRMADNSIKPIEHVAVGDLVQTLSGPKAVTKLWGSSYKECVEARTTKGVQRHPLNHRILTQLGWLSYAQLKQSVTCDNSSALADLKDTLPETVIARLVKEGQDQAGEIQTYSHPYSWRVFKSEVATELVPCTLTPVGVCKVYDLTVAGVNHYISGPGFVNQNSYSWLGIDELGDWEDQNAFFRCLSLNRYARAHIPTLRLRATCNPGGRGHAWIKRYFIDPAPGGYQPLYDEVLKCHRLFIPARIEDNKVGLQNDPNYESRLMRSGSPALVRALRYGDWNVVAGSYFNTFSSRNVIRPFEIPHWWTRFVAFDPGSSDPFCLTWWAVSDGSIPPYPKGALICYREWYGEKTVEDGDRIRGLKLSVAQIADGIKDRERGEKINYRVAGHDLWDTRKGASDAELYASLHNIHWLKAEIKRKQGWRRMYEMISGEQELPLAYWFENCIKCIEHIPLLQHSTRDVEDAEDSPLDHAPDSCRYAINSRPYLTKEQSKKPTIEEVFRPASLNDLWSEHENQLRHR